MNHIYRTVWHELSRTFVAVAEIVRSKGRAGSVSTAAQSETSQAGSEEKETCGTTLLSRRRQSPARRGNRLMALEQRFMFDGAAVTTAVEAAHALSDVHASTHDAPAPVEVREADPARNDGKKEVVFIENNLADYQTLVNGVKAGVEVELLDSTQDGLSQMVQWAQTHNGYDAIHILSHGSEGQINLGTLALDATAATSRASELSALGASLTANGDLLLYGCNVATGTGQDFVSVMASLSGADVAASNDPTGAASLGGDWQLEVASGSIAPLSVLSADARQSYAALLGTNQTFGFEGTVAGFNSKTVTDQETNGTLKVTSTVENMISLASMTGGGFTGSEGGATDFGTASDETSLKFEMSAGQTFDLTSITLKSYDENETIVLTSSKGGSISFTVDNNSPTVKAVSDANFQGISYFTITENTAGESTNGYALGFDDITVQNITAPGPTVTDANISITSTGSGTGGAYKIGDTVTAKWNNTGTGDNQAGITGVTMDFSAFGGGTAVTATNDGSGNWTANYQIIAGTTDAANLNVSVKATSASGNTTTSDTTNLTVDNQAPTVTDAKISISGASGTGGAYKIGDTVTATWNNTAGGDNNSDTISGVTVDFSQFGGGSTVAATNSGGTWTATYTMTAGSIDGSSRNISITATDNAGNTTTTADTTNATVDNIAPTLTDAKISISGASGAGGVYKIGDTVTATWNNTAGGDNNSDTISGVTVDFSQFGGGSAVAATNSGGTWTATYTIVAGALNNSTNRNVSATATDNAGNATTTADSTNATVDNVAPTITFSNLAFSSDTGASSADFLTQTASQTITATLSGAPAGTDIVYGSLDNGATWTDITSKVSGATLTWDNVTLSSSSTLKLKVADAAGNDGTVKSQAYTLDSSAPGAPSVTGISGDTGTSGSDGITSDQTLTISGTSEANATVEVFKGGVSLGTTTADGSGNWSYNYTGTTLAEGNYTFTAKATDAAGNTSSASSGFDVAVDTTAPASLALDATTIASSSATSTSTIATLSSTDTHAVTYSLAAGFGGNDADNGSFTISGTSLKVGGSSLGVGTYKIYVAATDAAGNVANQAFTLTVVNAPSVSSIARAGGASATVATAATSVDYTVTFSESVTGVDAGDFTLTAATGNASGSIANITGSGTTYTVTVNSLSGDGTLRLDLKNSGTGIQNGSNVDIASGYTSGQTYTLDHTAPSAPSTPDLSSGSDTGSSSSDDITSNTTPTFTGTAESGSTVTLYDTDGTTVLGTATATGGNWSITSSTLSEGSHTITAKATDAASNISSASSGLAATIDTTAPTVASVSVPANGSYKAGATLNFTVNASEAVTVDTSGGTPRLALDIGGSTVYANYASGSGSSALVFTYTVQPGDTDSDGIAVTGLQSNGGTLKDAAGNSMTLTLNSVGATTGVLADTTAPAVSSVSVPSNGTYYSNQNLDFTVNFSKAVTVNTTGGTPRIALTLDTGGTAYATYLSGSGTSALVFRYAVADGVKDDTGISVGTLSANGGTLRDAAGNDATLTLNSVGSTASVNVDGTQARILDVTSTTANGAYKTGDTVSITLTFTKAVTVDTTGGTPTLTLDSGGTARYASGSGSTTLVFTYTVGSGESAADLDYRSTSALALNGGTIKDSGGSHPDAVLTLASPGASGSLGANKDIVIDAIAPSIAFSNLAFSNDTGISSTDFITMAAAQTITATLSAAPSGTDRVYGSLDGGATWTDITAKVSGTTLTWDNVTLTGSGTLKFKVADSIGNERIAASQAYTLVTAAPAITLSGLALSDDTGISHHDFITKTAPQTITATLSAALASTDKVYGSLDGGATWTDITSKVSGTALTWGSVTLAGNGTLKFKVADMAGNERIVASQAYTLDTAAPATTVTTASFSADTGASSTDFITRTAAQTISGTLSANLASGETVYVSLDNGNTWTAAAAGTGQNTWSLGGQTLASSNTLKVKVTDAAGNDGPVYSQVYTLDTVAPATPSVAPLNTASITPVLTGTAPLGAGESLTVTVGDATYSVTPVGGSWSIDLSSAVPVSGRLALLPGNTYSVTATATDAAGNASTASGTLSIAAVPPATTTTTNPPATTGTATGATATPQESNQSASTGQPASSAAFTSAASAPIAFLPPALDSSIRNSIAAFSTSFTANPSTTPDISLASLRPPVTESHIESNQPQVNLTHGNDNSFQILVISNKQAASNEGLLLNRNMADQVIQSSGRTEIGIPADVFAHTDPNAVIRLTAQPANGQPLPDWVKFDARTGKFVVQTPKGVTGELSIKVMARDSQGREAVTVFKIRVSGKGQGQALLDHSGRPGLSEQIRMAAARRPGAGDSLERLAGLSRAARAAHG